MKNINQLFNPKYMKNRLSFISIPTISVLAFSSYYFSANTLCNGENNQVIENIEQKGNEIKEEVKKIKEKTFFQDTITKYRKSAQDRYFTLKNRYINNSNRIKNSFRNFLHLQVTPYFVGLERNYLETREKYRESKQMIIRQINLVGILPLGLGLAYFYRHKKVKSLAILLATPAIIITFGFPEIRQDLFVKTLKFFQLPSPDNNKSE
eukprot:TRINITY_DN7226_c0_g1_i1.p1 TRINITY_DN7226_c0_g1~~TRINITY_DN7226_c0_g1_i1.p1  ORF type:complete len:208 (-),score=36.51 TRINITY_DN7226_c0_g1_i1:56-679(-)